MGDEMRKSNVLKFLIGGTVYGLIEILWRGYTHWTMVLTGGACFLLLIKTFGYVKKYGIIPMAICGTVVITTIELIVGIVANIVLKMQVWDYSKMRGNLLGQICPQFSFLWFMLCLPLAFATYYKHTEG